MKRPLPMLCLTVAMSAAIGLSIKDSQADSKVYKSVDEQGVTTFSDEPQPGAKFIEVKPNIVNVTPLPPSQPSSRPPAKKAVQVPYNAGPSEDRYRHTGGYNYDDDYDYYRGRYDKKSLRDRVQHKAPYRLRQKAAQSGRPTARPASGARRSAGGRVGGGGGPGGGGGGGGGPGGGGR